ncbi:MAG TPA: cupin domain-containing protein [Alphaproteobacteria bacterium]|nr:cupin domain-containing protein [Alphaproteobacteria bacterium]
MSALASTRRQLLLAPLFAALPLALQTAETAAAGVDPTMTIVKLPDEIAWTRSESAPERSVEMAPLWSKTSEPGLYFTLVRWHPGYMSAPHWYETDRYCVVLSGSWWVASGEKFDPEGTVPAPAGSFVRRVARTPHYDGVKKDGKEPAVIAICGIGPITLHRVDESQPGVRKL